MKCKKCNSDNITKAGVSNNKNIIRQRYHCNDCKYTYVENTISRKKDITGLKFGKLLVINHLEGKLWNTICDCGKSKIANADRLRAKQLKSCGCLVSENARALWKKQAIKNRKELGYAASKKTYSNRKRDAKSRGIYFDITFEQFLKISSKNCYYCNIPPLQMCKYENTYGDYYYNGMDRVDSKKGYIIDNIVTCCWNCNKAKSSLSQSDFLNLIENIYNNRIKKK